MAMGIINGYQIGGVDMPTVASQYDPNTQWVEGDYCINGGSLYKALRNTTGNFVAADWQLTNSGAEIKNINSNLSDYDFSQTSISPTDFKDMIQQILNKVFQNSVYVSGTFNLSTSSVTRIDTGTKIRTLRIVGTFDSMPFVFRYDEKTPTVAYRKIGNNAEASFVFPNTMGNMLNKVEDNVFTMGYGSGYSSYGTLTYYVNE